MATTVPPPFLFRFSFPVLRREGLPGKGGRLNLPEECRIAAPAVLSGAKPFADVRLAWNDGGLAISVEAAGKSESPSGLLVRPDEADGLQVWIDTRNTQNIHRASRFCQSFCLLPNAEGPDGLGAGAVFMAIPRASAEPPRPDPESIRLTASLSRTSYLLEAWLPADTLFGFDPDSSPRLGFYYCVRDRELGEQYLTVGRDFPFNSDPSLWSTLELVK